MKVSMIALTFAALAVGNLAHAANPAPATTKNPDVVQAAQAQWSAGAANVAPKTRAEVRHELVQAEKDGQLASLNRTLYSGS